jgi:hypothetical protein
MRIKRFFFLFINDTLSYSFQANTRANSWLLLPIDTDEKEEKKERTKYEKKNKGLMKGKNNVVNQDTFAKNPTDRQV